MTEVYHNATGLLFDGVGHQLKGIFLGMLVFGADEDFLCVVFAVNVQIETNELGFLGYLEIDPANEARPLFRSPVAPFRQMIPVPFSHRL
jgi:hypothetical protein